MEEDYKILTTPGNIAFYKSCEITELFLQRKTDKAIFNFFTLAVFEEKLFDKFNHLFLCKPIRISREWNLCIQRYWLSTEEAGQNYIELKDRNKWNFQGNCDSQFPILKC